MRAGTDRRPAGRPLLNFFLEEIDPATYDQAIADAQTRMHLRASHLTSELYFPEFQYWPKLDAKCKKRS